jgi:hypothetical protein
MAVDNEDGVAVSGDCGLLILLHRGALDIQAQSNQNFLCAEKVCFSKKFSFLPLSVFIPTMSFPLKH